MKKTPIFISFHTGSPYYSLCSNNLVSKIKYLGSEIKMEKIKDTGHYWKNTLLKPKFILDQLKDTRNDLIWIDADTDILEITSCMKSWDSDIIAASHTGNIHGIKASPLGIKYNEIDLDHDILKYEILPLFVNKITIQIFSCGGSPNDYTDGKFIKNGISKGLNKGNETKIVINKNESRNKLFNSLSLENFKNYE